MKINIQGRPLDFVQVPMIFRQHNIVNLFAGKNNKTLAETLVSRRYIHLMKEVQHRYPNSLNEKLGEYLYKLKVSGDNFYRRFLNKHGDNVFCDFVIEKTPLSRTKGVYCFTVGEVIKYFGRSHDPFEKRLNQGYGHISPKNCYLDGQSTNCHINSIIAMNDMAVAFYVCPIDNDLEIDQLERVLISIYKPEWNILLNRNGG
jgi:hypothetical protein